MRKLAIILLVLGFCSSSLAQYPQPVGLDFDQNDCGDSNSTTFCAGCETDNAFATEIEARAADVIAAGGGTIYLETCSSTITSQIDISPNSNQEIHIIGAGSSSTIITRDATAGATKHLVCSFPNGNFSPNTSYFEIAGIGFVGDQVAAGDSIGIYMSNADDFRIHHNEYYNSRWSSGIEFKANTRGLVDQNTFDGSMSHDSAYAMIEFGQNFQCDPENLVCINDPINHTGCDDGPCDTYYTEEVGEGSCTSGTWCEDCRDSWWDWFDDPDCNNGVEWVDDWMPGDVDHAVYIENNIIKHNGPFVATNSAARQAVVVRYNDCTQYEGGNLFPIKPGTFWIEIYNNKIWFDSGSGSANLGTQRSSGVFYNNQVYDDTANIITAGDINAYFVWNGFGWPDQVLFDEFYIWGNTIAGGGTVSCGGGDMNASGCWQETEGDLERIAPDVNYFFRAPTTGDRIYSGNPSLPATQGTCPHASAGAGSCDNTKYGRDGYTLGGGGGSPSNKAGAGSVNRAPAGTSNIFGAE